MSTLAKVKEKKAKAKPNVKVIKAKVIAIDKKSIKRKAIWLGAQSLLGPMPATGSKENKERGLILMASRALGVSPFGVNILGNLPYINKLGLSQKAQQYQARAQFKYNWIKRALDDSSEKAICECKVVDAKGNELSDWITGECSPSTTKMSTLKGYQNHMAQTRAKNRAILETFGVRIHEDMIERIQQLNNAKVLTSRQAAMIGGAASSSTDEEIQIDSAKVKEQSRESEEMKHLLVYACQNGAQLNAEKKFIEQKLGRTINWDQDQE